MYSILNDNMGCMHTSYKWLHDQHFYPVTHAKKINLPVNIRDTNVMFLLNISNINECLNMQFKVGKIKEATKTCHWSNMCLHIPWGSVWGIMGFLWPHVTKGAECLFTCKLLYSRGKRMQMLSHFFFSIDKTALSMIVD